MSISTSMMEPLGFWLKNLDQIGVHSDSQRVSGQPGEASKEGFHAKREAFSRSDIDALLKKIGLKPSEQFREIAKFLLSHRFNLNAEMVQKVQQLMPEGPYVGQKSEALIAALSKLPLAQVARGFEILLATLNHQHSTVMGSIQHFMSQLNDVLSETRLYQGQLLKVDLIQAAFTEELEQWQSWISKPENQLLALLDRQTVLQDLRKFIHLSQWAAKILEHLEKRGSEGLRRRMALATKAADHAAKVILADGILSKVDEFRHMRDHGLCYSLGLDWEDDLVPCRLWAFDDQHFENTVVDDQDVHLFFRVVGEHLGLIEIDMVLESNLMKLRLFSESDEIRMLLDRESESLTEHLIKLGYEVKMYPATSKMRQADPSIEIESRVSHEIMHMDVKA